MVQRKAAHIANLCIQPHHLKAEDVKNRSSLADLKTKKMKKSGSIKRTEFSTPRTPKPVKQPRKHAQTTPNYMKSTTSSDARNDQSRADTRNARRKCSSSNGLKAAACKNSTVKTGLKTLIKNPSFKPARTTSLVKKCSRVALCEELDVKRATCSSTLKDCKFPKYLSLHPGGTELEGKSTVKVCPYTYCSLNGHRHASLPPLKSFLSAKRLMIKAHKSIKLGCLSPRRAKPVIQDELKSPGFEEEEEKDFFVEIYTKKNEDIVEDAESMEKLSDVTSIDTEEQSPFPEENSKLNDQSCEMDSEASDMDSETGFYSPLFLDYAYEYSTKGDVEPDPDAEIEESSVVGKDVIIEPETKDGCFDEHLGDDASQESYEESFSSDEFSSSEDDVESIASYSNLHVSDGIEISSEPELSPPGDSVENFTNLSRDDSTQAESSHLDQKAKAENPANQETEEDSVLTLYKGKCKKPVNESDEFGAFNPREPNFLPIEPDPESEKVNLKHQDLDDRKNTEEWMVDYALRQAVTKLGQARKKKVALLVEAFEKVMPITKCEIQISDGSMFDQGRQMQACS